MYIRDKYVCKTVIDLFPTLPLPQVVDKTRTVFCSNVLDVGQYVINSQQKRFS